MSKKLVYLTSVVLVLALAGTNVAFGADLVWEGRITSGADDVEDQLTRGMYNTSTDLEFFNDGGLQVIGLRFLNVTITPGAVISKAYVEFLCDETGGGTQPVNAIIEGELKPNAPAFTSAANNVTSRPRTTAKVVWTPVNWTTVGQKDQTSNIAPVIEEIVNQPGWVSGNALVLIFSDDPAKPSTGVRCADAYEDGAPNAPLLHIEWSPIQKYATQPNPADNQTDVLRDVSLSWKPGAYADKHDVYLGTNVNDVNNASRANPRGVLVSQNQVPNSYSPAAVLQWGQTYYWRIDEVNRPPDFTVYKGSVWQFTVEPFAYPIAGTSITATASSQFSASTGPQNTVNGSGLDAADLHSTAEAATWLSSMTGAQPTWIQYEFDRVYKLHQMWVWNYNATLEPIIGFGFKDVTIGYSSDGVNWATLGTTHQFARAPGTPGYAHNTTIDLGVPAKYVKLTANSNWGGVLPQYGLSEVRFFHVPVFAREPNPASGATDTDVDAVLSWRAGREAAKHKVYFSDSNQAVIAGTAPVTTVSQTIYGPLSLALDKTYYWRVDEVNEAKTPTTWQGDVWNFIAQKYLVVDNFEDYNDFEPHRIFDTWIDGWNVPANGSQVGYATPPFAEKTIIHNGMQSMPFAYENTAGATYSEAERTFAAPQNWTEHGVKTLSLWFCGAASNVAGQLYVKVNGSKVTYDGEASNLTRAGWQAWNITLASSGVANLQRVTKLSIGVDGNGAKGTLYFDDIRLYPYDRQLITPVEPSNAGLVGHWKFDGDARDSSGLNNHGTIGGNPTYVAGKVGTNALNLDGSDYVAIDGVVNDITSTNLTLSAWVKTTQSSVGYVLSSNDSASAHPISLGVNGGNPYVYDGGSGVQHPPAVNDGQWHLLTYVRSGSTGYIYVDGLLRVSYSTSFTLTSVTRWSIGQEWDDGTPSDFYNGVVDDARIYNRSLSQEEAAWLAGFTKPFDKPF